MSLIRSLLLQLRMYRAGAARPTQAPPETGQYEALVRAHGDWLAFLATILEREHVIAGDELARLLSEFASVTAVDRPAEGRVLSFWASRLQETATSLRDFPSVH